MKGTLELIGVVQNSQDRRAVSDAVAELYASHKNIVFYQARTYRHQLTSDDIESIGLVTVWQTAKKFDSSRGVVYSTYLTGALKRELLKASEQGRALQTDSDDTELPERVVSEGGWGFDPSTAIEASEQAEELLDGLTESQREIAALLGHLSQAEIAKRLGVSREWVSQTVKRVRRNRGNRGETDRH